MNYELVKKLKEAGFPQHVTGTLAFNKNGEKVIISSLNGDIDFNELVLAPNLEELIEACGDIFLNIHKIKNMYFIVTVDDTNIWLRGKTPSEAVSKLWLELNK